MQFDDWIRSGGASEQTFALQVLLNKPVFSPTAQQLWELLSTGAKPGKWMLGL